jgi:outer membrane protein OmpA-like peptidoglycan-associated protein
MINTIIIILFSISVQYCSSGEQKPQISKDNTQVLPVAPLLDSPEIQEKAKQRTQDFSWRLEFSEKEMRDIRVKADTPQNRKYLIDRLNNRSLSNGLRLYIAYKIIAWELAKNKPAEAVQVLNVYSKEFPQIEKDLKELSSLLKEKSESVRAIDQGSEINSYDSYLPVPELSGKKMYYTSMKTPNGKGGEEIVEALAAGNTWKSRRFLEELNSQSHDSVCSVSADGTGLILFGHYASSLGGGDLFLSTLTEQGWTPPKNFGKPVNSPGFDSDGIFTPDGKAILFTSDRLGGYFPHIKKGMYHAGSYWGNTDIYISFLQENGSFGTPINLGPMINTPGAERTPFLHPDGKTLYFSSNGYNVNLGDLDVYKSVRLDDTWTNWSEPINIGKELNTSGTDWGFKLTAASDRGFMSKLNVTKNLENIYAFTPLPKKALPEERVIAIEGRIMDENGQPLEADIEWENLNTSKPLGKLRSNPQTGDFFITLPLGEVYVYFARKSGYLSQSQNIDLSNEKVYQIRKIEIPLVSIKQAARSGKEIVLGNILFESDSNVLDKRSIPELDRFLSILEQNPEVQIEIQGHTSKGRTEDFNMKLSKERAESVASYLFSKGIPSKRIKTEGYGSSKPIAENNTEQNKAKNRRVSFRILEGTGEQ